MVNFEDKIIERVNVLKEKNEVMKVDELKKQEQIRLNQNKKIEALVSDYKVIKDLVKFIHFNKSYEFNSIRYGVGRLLVDEKYDNINTFDEVFDNDVRDNYGKVFKIKTRINNINLRKDGDYHHRIDYTHNSSWRTWYVLKPSVKMDERLIDFINYFIDHVLTLKK